MTIRNLTRREFLRDTAATGSAAAVVGTAGLGKALAAPAIMDAPQPSTREVTIRLNGADQALQLDTRTTLLDALREELHLTGTKKGCDMGACGACTVLVDGERILSCLALAVQCEGRDVVTIEGVAQGGALHPLQQAFIEHDGFQCGYCTPGQICSAIGMAAEVRRGAPSHVSADLAGDVSLTREELQERMSGNLCRCGAHNGIIEAIAETFAARVPA